ncbi:MAG: ABC transporter ATP-binding protein [Methanocella sp.]
MRVEGLSFSYQTSERRVPVLADIDLEVSAGERLAILGPSGCGKTTLMYILAGLLTPEAGRVWVGGEPLTSRRRQTAFILQDYGLLPWKTVRQNVALGPEIRKQPAAETGQRVDATLSELGLSNHQGAYPSQLSGGQKQRVAIARALVLDPDLMLMDEPFSALDALTRERLQDELYLLWRKRRMTMLIVTHSIEEAVFLGRRVAVMSPWPNRLAFVQSPMDGLEYRKTAAFHQACLEVRKRLEECHT